MNYVQLDIDHPILKDLDYSNIKGSFTHIESGLECPFGKDYNEIVSKLPNEFLVGSRWIFKVKNEKKWFLAKIKYGI